MRWRLSACAGSQIKSRVLELAWKGGASTGRRHLPSNGCRWKQEPAVFHMDVSQNANGIKLILTQESKICQQLFRRNIRHEGMFRRDEQAAVLTMKSQHQPETKVGQKSSNVPLKTHFKFKLQRSVWFLTHIFASCETCAITKGVEHI